MDELLPCAHCGADAEYTYTVYMTSGEPTGMHWAGCSGCGIGTNTCDTKGEAVALWNRRAQPAPVVIAMPGTGCSACGWANGDWVCNDKCRPQ